MSVGGRFRIRAAQEIHRDPGGHDHHWTVLEGEVVVGSVNVGDELAVPRPGGGAWPTRVLGIERGFRKPPTESAVAGEAVLIAVWAVAPPGAEVDPADAAVLSEEEAAALAARTIEERPEVIEHCADCRKLLGRHCSP